MRKLNKIILSEVGVGNLKIRPRGDNRCESAKCNRSAWGFKSPVKLASTSKPLHCTSIAISIFLPLRPPSNYIKGIYIHLIIATRSLGIYSQLTPTYPNLPHNGRRRREPSPARGQRRRLSPHRAERKQRETPFRKPRRPEILRRYLLPSFFPFPPLPTTFCPTHH